MNNVDGKMITQCFNLLSQFCKELNAFDIELRHQVAKEFSPKNMETEQNTHKNYELAPSVLPYKTTRDIRLEETQWIYQDYAVSFPLKELGKESKDINHLGFQISLSGNGVAISDCQPDCPFEPLLHVCFWQSPIKFSTGYYMAFPIEDEPHEIISKRLIKWDPPFWTFSLRLTSLKNSNDIDTYVIRPAVKLLHNMDPLEALPYPWFETVLVKYPY